ncbi:MAG: hypothetical protein AAF293_06225 [Pseudomonadota bacterium]
MSDTKKNPEQDIVASAEDQPEIIGDENLGDVDGGWSWGSSTLSTTTTNVVMSGGSTMLKIDGIDEQNDGLVDSMDANMLRTRPGRIGWGYGF